MIFQNSFLLHNNLYATNMLYFFLFNLFKKLRYLYSLKKVSHEQDCGFNIHPYFQVPTHTLLQSLSLSVVKCHRVTTCLCAGLLSPWPTYIVIANYSNMLYFLKYKHLVILGIYVSVVVVILNGLILR